MDELARRFAEENARLAETLSAAEEAYRFLKPRLRDLPHEVFSVIFLNQKHGGHVSPSPDDLRLTEDMKAILAHLDVRVVDHLIVGGNGYFSFAREGLLNG